MIIAIESVEGINKSSVANILSQKYGYVYISFELYFRAFAWCDINAIDYKCDDLLFFKHGSDGIYPAVYYNCKDITNILFENLEIENMASTICDNNEYQEYMLNIVEKNINKNIVIDKSITKCFSGIFILNVFLDVDYEKLKKLNKFNELANKVSKEYSLHKNFGFTIKKDYYYIDTTNQTLIDTAYEITRRINSEQIIKSNNNSSNNISDCNKDKLEKSISIIVVAYGRLEHLHLCIGHLMNQSMDKDAFEIIVICDYNQGLSSIYKVSNIKIIEIPDIQYYGVGYGRNIGLENASGNTIVFLDTDMLVLQDFLVSLQSIHNKVNNAVVLGARRYLPEGQTACEEMITIRKESREILLSNYSLDMNYLTNPWSICYSCNVSLPTSLARKCLFSSDFKGWGLEDVEWGYRLNENNVNWIFSTKILGYHLYHDRIMSVRKFEQWKKNLNMFKLKHNTISVRNFSIFSSVFDPDIKSDYLEIYKLYNNQILKKAKVMELLNKDINDTLTKIYDTLFSIKSGEQIDLIFIISERVLEYTFAYSRYYRKVDKHYRIFTDKIWNNVQEEIVNQYEMVEKVSF